MPPYLTPAEVRERRPQLKDPAVYSDAELADLVAEFEEIAERYRGVAFVPRTATETINRPTARVMLTHWPLREVESFTVDGVDGVVDDLHIDLPLATIYGGGWCTATPLVVTYSHGLDEPPPKTLLRACAEYVRATAMADRSGTSRDIIGQSFEGAYTRYSTANWEAGRPTGFMEVDRLLNSLPDHRVPGIA